MTSPVWVPQPSRSCRGTELGQASREAAAQDAAHCTGRGWLPSELTRFARQARTWRCLCLGQGSWASRLTYARLTLPLCKTGRQRALHCLLGRSRGTIPRWLSGRVLRAGCGAPTGRESLGLSCLDTCEGHGLVLSLLQMGDKTRQTASDALTAGR